MKHTPEPWTVVDTGERYRLGTVSHYNDEIAEMSYHVESWREQQEADFNRIVTCVNACTDLTETQIREAITKWKDEQ